MLRPWAVFKTAHCARGKCPYGRSAHTRRDRHGLFPHVFDRGSRVYAKVLVRHDHGCGAERYRSFFGNGGQHGGSVPDRLHCPRICHRLRHVGSEKARCENAIRFRACEYALGSGCEHHRKLYRISFERSCTAAVCFGRTDKRCNMWCSGKRAARTAGKSQTN